MRQGAGASTELILQIVTQSSTADSKLHNQISPAAAVCSPPSQVLHDCMRSGGSIPPTGFIGRSALEHQCLPTSSQRSRPTCALDSPDTDAIFTGIDTCIHIHAHTRQSVECGACVLGLPGGPVCPTRGSLLLRALSCQGLAHLQRKLTGKIRMKNARLKAESTTIHVVLKPAHRSVCWQVQ